MSQQFGMEPSHSPPWGPMLVSQYKLLHISLAESQCSSCRSLLKPKASVPVAASLLKRARACSETPPRCSGREKAQKTNKSTTKPSGRKSHRAQIFEVRLLRPSRKSTHAQIPPPPEPHRKGEPGKQENRA